MPAERARVVELRDIVREKRHNFLTAVTNNTDVRNLERLVSMELAKYEISVQEAVQGGLVISVDDDFPADEEKWSVMQAVFFSSTVLTTIGEWKFKTTHITNKLSSIMLKHLRSHLSEFYSHFRGKFIKWLIRQATSSIKHSTRSFITY